MFNKSALKFGLLIFFASLLMSACGSQLQEVDNYAGTSIQLIDGLERTISLEAPAERIVSLAPSNTEILFAIGAGNQIVGRDEFSDYPPEALDLPSIGGSFGDLNTEAIAALEPDLILAAEINTADQVKALEDLGMTVYWLANPNTLEEMYDNLRIVAQLTGHGTDAETLIADLSARVQAVDDALKDLTELPNVFYEIDGNDPNAPWTSGAGTFIHLLITRAKGINIGSVLDGEYAQISIEELIIQNPQIILLGDTAFGVTPESVTVRAGWENLLAVQNNQVFPFDDNLASRPGPRLVDGLEAMARLLHPEAFN
ncbi:MAG: cobalamin-binding protein [Chloroflexi bacterium]|nr:cobalamin-binding protein [Chloroflexota bacterium]